MGRPKKSPKQAANELAIEKRRASAANLRLAGWSIRDIAAHLSCSVGTIHSDLTEVFERTQDKADDALKRERAISVARIEAANKGLWTKVVAGDTEAVQAFVKLDARRGKLLGLDAPTKQEIAGPGGGPIPLETKSALEAKLDQLAKRLAPPEPGGTPSA